MAIVSISIDTKTRAVAMTVDGTIVPADSVYLNKSQDYDGKPYLRFEYTTRAKNASGLEEIHGYFLPPPDDTAASATANEHGLVEHQMVDAAKAVADIQAYFAQAKPMKGQMPDKHAGSPEMQRMMKKHKTDMQGMMGGKS